MLYKIFFWTLIGSLVATIVFLNASPKAAASLGRLALEVDTEIVKVKLGYVLPALIVAVVFRIFKVHDGISDIFGIRKNFDVQEILVPLAGEANFSVNLERLASLQRNREKLMYTCFYEYASSTAPKIDQHLIRSALDRWSWFWVLAELLAVNAILIVLLMSVSAFRQAAWSAVVMIVGLAVMTFCQRACASIAHAQVERIVANPTFLAQISKNFNEI